MAAKKAKKTAKKHAKRAKKHAKHKKATHKKHETPVERSPSFVKNNMWQVGVVVVIILAVVLFISLKETPTADTDSLESGESTASGSEEQVTTGGSTATSFEGDKVPVEFYVMSQCPYGTQVEDAIAPVLKKMGDAVDFRLNFIANDNGDGTFRSLHGQAEVEGNIYQLCVGDLYPDKLMDFVTCQNENMGNIPDNWESCAERLSLDKDKIQSCFEGEGKDLLADSIQETQEIGASGSPTMYFNGQLYRGGRDELSFQREICKYVPDHEECATIPACGSNADCTAQPDKNGKCLRPNQKDAECVYEDPVEFEVIVINDETCGASCDTSRITSVTNQLFKGAEHRYIDISDPEAQEFIEEMDLTLVPAYVFEPKVTETYAWTSNAQLASAFTKAGDYYRLTDAATGASRYISEEARQQYYDQIGLTPGDNTPQVDFFVMSYCPYGNQAEELLEPVYQQLKGKADFVPRYVIYSNYNGGGPQYCIDEASELCSMHGVVELNQDIREKCVFKYDGIDAWFDFALAMNEQCNSQNADTCWEGVADAQGLDKARIEQCFEEEGEDLMREDKQIGDVLGVSGSPTIFFEGERYGGSRTVEGFMSAMCSGYDNKPSECDEIPEAPASSAAAPAAGACG